MNFSSAAPAPTLRSLAVASELDSLLGAAPEKAREEAPKKLTPAEAVAKAMRVYKVTLGLFTAIILFVFAEPTVRRVMTGLWQRGHFTYVSTTSLNVHAVMGYSFLFLVLAQYAVGFRLKKGSRRMQMAHKGIGRLLFFGMIPLFVLVTAWTIVDRSTHISPERSVIFAHARPMIRGALAVLLVFMAGHAVRSYRAIKNGDVGAHVDSAVAIYVIAGGIALIRFLYFLFWATLGECPFSVIGMYVLTVLCVIGAFLLSYGLAGRLRQNLGPIVTFAAANVILLAAGWGSYTILDVAQ